jgi:hypothetical protein
MAGQDFRGTCNLRFDDTNPVTEDVNMPTDRQRAPVFDWEDWSYVRLLETLRTEDHATGKARHVDS